jgi:hypothetical protein
MNVARDEDYYYFQAADSGHYSITLDSNWIPIYNWGADYDQLIVYASDTITTIGANPLNWMMGPSPTNFTVPSAGRYYIRLHCGDGYSLKGYSFKLTGNTVPVKLANNTPGTVPKEFALEKNYPNPFISNTTIRYQLPENSSVRIKIFDGRGREIKDLVHEYKTAGRYKVDFSGADLAGGIYFYEIKAGRFFAKREMLLTR